MRITNGRADGRPQPELAFVGFMGTGRQVVVVGGDPRVEGADVLYRLDGSTAASVFASAVNRGVVLAEVCGLALVQPRGRGA